MITIHLNRSVGDLLVFPPLWGHSVLTQAGENVMLNLRRRSLGGLLSQPRRFIESVLSSLILGARSHSTAKLNKLQAHLFNQRMAKYSTSDNWVPPESSCKEIFRDILNKE